ncbi:DUF6515 family protein [Rubritalea profundi]|uniref:DUF6515 family protein n=1 Tax=Rubritalea profundi TaxID=1658618 RepID=UPI00101AD670|nr:DUF6515 family protein [Rubritalea profundi]
MKTPFLLGALGALTLLLLSSCVDPNYYGESVHYGSASYTTLPNGHNTVYVSGTPYYHHGSQWYRRSSGRYISCSRPHGYHGSIGHSGHHSSHGISRLPYGYRSVTVGSSSYYNHGSTWYRKSGSRYVTCQRPSGYSSHNQHKSHGYSSSSKHHRSDSYRRPSSHSSHSSHSSQSSHSSHSSHSSRSSHGTHDRQRNSSDRKKHGKATKKHSDHSQSVSPKRGSSTYVSTRTKPSTKTRTKSSRVPEYKKKKHTISKQLKSKSSSDKGKRRLR